MAQRLIFFIILGLICLIPGKGMAQEDHDQVSETYQQTYVFFIARGNPFWLRNARYAEETARQLGVRLIISNFRDDSDELLRQVKAFCRQGINGMIFEPYDENAEQVLAIADKYDVPVINIHTRIGGAGEGPRTKYKQWIGEIYSDHALDSATLAQYLISSAVRHGHQDVNMLAIGGNPEQQASSLRVSGLKDYVADKPSLNSLHVVDGYWNLSIAKEAFEKHYKQHPDVNVVWCASDSMALGVSDAIKEMGLEKRIIVGGIGSDEVSINALMNRELDILVGAGYFISASWALILLHDYNHGHDFKSQGISFPTAMPTIDIGNYIKYKRFLNSPPSKIDFKTYSKVKNPELKLYDLNITSMVDDFFLMRETLALSFQEIEFLHAHPLIRVHNEKGRPPFDFNRRGHARGFAVDYLNKLGDRLGVQFEYVNDRSWGEAISHVKNRELDMVMHVMPNQEHAGFMLFTEPYTNSTVVIVARADEQYQSVAGLSGKVLAMVEGSAIIPLIKAQTPEIVIKTYPDSLSALQAVAIGEAEAAMDIKAVARYLIRVNMLSNLVLSGPISSLEQYTSHMSFGIRSDWPLLHSALNKAMADLSEEEVHEIQNKWLIISSDDGDESVMSETAEDNDFSSDKSTSWSVVQIIAMMVGSIVLLLVVNWLLIHFMGQYLPVGLQSIQSRLIGVGVMSGFLATVTLGAIFGLNRLENHLRQNTGAQLKASLSTTREALHTWVEKEKTYALLVSNHPEIEQRVQLLLDTPDSERHQRIHDQTELNRVFSHQFSDNTSDHYQIINRANEVISSDEIDQIGEVHALQLIQPEMISRAFHGEMVCYFSGDHYGVDISTYSTLYILAPISDDTEEVIAVLVLEYPNLSRFNQVMQASRFGATGNIYAMDHKGYLLTAGRFHDQDYFKALQSDNKGGGYFKLVSPGADLTKGKHPSKHHQPKLIHSAHEVITGKTGQSVSGYEGYRGVRVLGAWDWDHQLGVGLVAEMDEHEAMSPYRESRLMILSVLAISVALAFVLTGFFVWSGERANVRIKQARDEWERVAAEKAEDLKQREEKFKAIFDQTYQRMAVLDPQGRVLEMNRAAMAEQGLPQESVRGMYFWEAMQFQRSPETTEQIRLAIEQAGAGEFVRFELVYDTLDSVERVMDFTVNRVTDDDGNLLFILPMAHEITELKYAEQVLRENEERLRFSLVAMEAYYWVYDATEKNWQYDSSKFWESMGYDASQISDDLEAYNALIHPDDLPCLQEELHDYLYGEYRVLQVEFRMKRADGQWVWVQNIGQGIARDTVGQITRLAGLTLNITERKQAEDALQNARQQAVNNADELERSLETSEKLREEALVAKLNAEEAVRMKAEFLATMSHEIRTPLNGVLGMVQLLRETQLDPRQRDYVETVHSSGNALLTIINDILDLSKFEADKMTLENMHFEPRSLLNGLTNLMRNRADDKGLVLNVNIDPHVPGMMIGDANRLRQVMLNYLSNAIKFTSEGDITISLYPDPQRPEWLRFDVADTGIGISETDRKKLFNEFSQVDSSISRRYGGTGLGLFICKKIIELMQGDLGVDSQPGKGSTFWFSIPPVKINAENSDTVLKDDIDDKRVYRLPPLKILLVEDNVVNQEVTEAFLLRDKHDVTIAENGLIAVQRARENKYDLVLMDMRMPVMGGREATRKIREHESETGQPRVPIIALTASVMSGHEDVCEEAGMDGFLSKPVDLQELMRVIQAVTRVEPVSYDLIGMPELQTSTSCLNLNQLKELEQMSSISRVQEILQSFLEDMKPEIEALVDQAKAESWDVIASQAHKIKGASANLGMQALSEHAHRIENALKNGNTQLSLWDINAMQSTLKLTMAELNTVYPDLEAAMNAKDVTVMHAELSVLPYSIYYALESLTLAIQSSAPSAIQHALKPLEDLEMTTQYAGVFQMIKTHVNQYRFKPALEAVAELRHMTEKQEESPILSGKAQDT